MRPWRGPLLRPKPASVAVLGDFLPIQLQSDLENRSAGNPKGNRPRILGHDELILWAKSFGRPSLNLEIHRGSRVAQQQGQQGPSSRLTQPLQIAGSTSKSLGNPTYTAMAARPPPAGAQAPAQRGQPPPQGAAGAGPSGRQPPPPSGLAVGGPAGAQQRREIAYWGQNFGGGHRPQHRNDGGDRRWEWRPANRPANRLIQPASRPSVDQCQDDHLSRKKAR
jgi:hypothetical protein